MARPCLLLAAALLGLALPLSAAKFSMPLVDISPNKVSSSAMIAIWSATDAYVTPNTQVDVIFPPDYLVPTTLNPASCVCVFMRYTSTTAGAWTASEVTVTAGSYSGTGSMVSISLPAAMHPGKFYIRFDATASFDNPASTGLGTLALVDPEGNTTLSRGFYIKATYTAAVALGAISGTVKDSNGKAFPGALVMASTFSSYLPISIAARRQWVGPMAVSTSVYTAATAGDGSYSLSVPPGSYNLKAEVWRSKNGALQTSNGTDSATVAEGATVVKPFTLAPLP